MRNVILLVVVAGCAARGVRPTEIIRETQSLRLAGRWDEAHQRVSRALARPGLGRDDRALLLVERSTIEREVGTYRRFDSMATARATIGEAEALVGPASPAAVRAGALEARGWLIYRSAFDKQAKFDDAMPMFDEARRLREQTGEPARLARAWFAVGLVHQQSGRNAQAKEAFERGHVVATRADLPVELGYLERHLASVAEDGGDLEGALRGYQRSLELREKAGHRWGVVFARIVVAEALMKKGELDRAATLLDRAAALAAELEIWVGIASTHESRARLDHAAGRSAAACRDLEQAAIAWLRYGDGAAASEARVMGSEWGCTTPSAD